MSTSAVNPSMCVSRLHLIVLQRWLAPEIMAGGSGSPAADVYAYGVVMWEVLTLELPWSKANPWQIVSLVNSGGRLEIPALDRLPGPDTATFNGLDAYCQLLRHCWAQNEFDRPTFQEIIQKLRCVAATHLRRLDGSRKL